MGVTESPAMGVPASRDREISIESRAGPSENSIHPIIHRDILVEVDIIEGPEIGNIITVDISTD